MFPKSSNKSIIISGNCIDHVESLRSELSQLYRQVSTLILNSDALYYGDSSSEIRAKTSAAFDALENTVDIFVVDARTHDAHGRDAIWQVPVSEWDKGHDTPQTLRRSMLLQIKSFLSYQFGMAESGKPIRQFFMAILGYEHHFDNTLISVILKLQRDISALHPEALIRFIDLESPTNNATSLEIATAISVVASSVVNGPIVTLKTIHCTPGEGDNKAISEASTNGPENTRLEIYLNPSRRRPKVKIALSFDFDALSAFLGTGQSPENSLSDYSTGVFSGTVGGRRLLRMLQKYEVADKTTWFMPAHTMETFESTVKEIVQSGAEIALHGYAHEGAHQMTPEQERQVLLKCMEVSQRITGTKVKGWRAPMYKISERTIELLKEFGFLYDSSLSPSRLPAILHPEPPSH